MEITIKVDDSEGPFLMEMLRNFSFVREVTLSQSTAIAKQVNALWQLKAHKIFATQTDLLNWLNVPNRSIDQDKPINLLQTDEGYQAVINLLGRMEHGVMA